MGRHGVDYQIRAMRPPQNRDSDNHGAKKKLGAMIVIQIALCVVVRRDMGMSLATLYDWGARRQRASARPPRATRSAPLQYSTVSCRKQSFLGVAHNRENEPTVGRLKVDSFMIDPFMNELMNELTCISLLQKEDSELRFVENELDTISIGPWQSTHADLVMILKHRVPIRTWPKNPACGVFCLISLACSAFFSLHNLACGACFC